MIATLTSFLLLGKITRGHKRTDCICTVGSACHCKALLLRVGRSGGTSATCELLEAKLNANRHNNSLSSLFRSTRLDSCSIPMIDQQQHNITLINAKSAFKLMFWKSQSSPSDPVAKDHKDVVIQYYGDEARDTRYFPSLIGSHTKFGNFEALLAFDLDNDVFQEIKHQIIATQLLVDLYYMMTPLLSLMFTRLRSFLIYGH
ncbi:hypothetical protein Peur_003182 [Populus x canadensis]